MKRIFLFIFLVLFYTANSQDEGRVTITLPVSETSCVLSIYEGVISFNLGISAIQGNESVHGNIPYTSLAIPAYFNDGLPGEPSLPVYSSLLEKNSSGNYNLEIHSLDSLIIDLDDYFEGSRVSPAQPSIQKGMSAHIEEFLINDSIYNLDKWISLPLVNIVDEGIMRGVNIGRVSFNPLQYNPHKNLLKVFYNIRGELVPEVGYTIDTEIGPSDVFDKVMGPVVREQKSSVLKKLVKDQAMTLVVLTDSIFSESLQPLLEWKRKKGFHVIEAYTDDPLVGDDRTSIKSYLSDLYHTPPGGVAPPSYLLIVGDVEHVPLSQGSGQTTDLYFTTYDSIDDYLPDLFQGRISVKDDSQLEVVIDKILEYEQYKFPDPDFLNRSILIAGNDASHASTWGNGQINYAAQYYFNEAHNISGNTFLHPEASSSDEIIREAISEGATLVNYTGHGDTYGWLDPAFNTSHIGSLSNSKKYPVLIGNGCRTNVFDLSSRDCFAEAIVKAEGKGALAYIGCTNDSYWDEDFYWAVGVGEITADPVYESTGYGYYDKVFHDGAEPIDDWTPSLGEMIFGGNMAVQQSSSTLKKYYWEIYQLMGDPTLVPWFTEPGNPAVTYPDSLAAGASQVPLVTEPYDYTAISVEGVLLDAKHADGSGQSTLDIPLEYRGDTLLLVVTGDHRQPFIRQIPDAGHFELLSINLSNESILEDSLFSNGEMASFNIAIKNISTVSSDECNLILKTSESINLIDSLVLLPVVGPGDTLELENAFSFNVIDDAIDQSLAWFSFTRENDITLNTLEYDIQLYAPMLKLHSVSVNDDLYGNGNSIIESGEEIFMSFEIENTGSYSSDSIRIVFDAADTIFDDKKILTGQKLLVSESRVFTADIIIPELSDQSEFYLVPISIGDGNYFLEDIYMIIGKYIEDFSTDSIWLLPWVELDWYRDTSDYFFGPASLRSGEIGHKESSSAELKVHVFEPDSLVFNYKVSSESGYDYLKFYVDGNEEKRWSGISGWERHAQELEVGLHDIKWSYTKDSNTTAGEDAAWIDNVIFPTNAFIPDLYIDTITIPRRGSALEEESFSIVVNNLGLDTINDFSVRFRKNDESWSEISFVDTLVPGIMKEIAIPATVDFSEVREHLLQVVVNADEDIWPWNDSLTALIDHYAYPDLSISLLNYDSIRGEYVNLVAQIQNTGNVVIEYFYYNVIIDEEFSSIGKSSIDLEPGLSTETSFNLINEYHEWIEIGWHDYRIELAEDSVLENNSLSGSVYWNEPNVSLNVREGRGIQLYPNPASEILFIELTDDIQLPCTLAIKDVMGRVLIVRELNSIKETISLESALSSDGIYHINIYDRSGKFTFNDRFIYLK